MTNLLGFKKSSRVDIFMVYILKLMVYNLKLLRVVFVVVLLLCLVTSPTPKDKHRTGRLQPPFYIK